MWGLIFLPFPWKKNPIIFCLSSSKKKLFLHLQPPPISLATFSTFFFYFMAWEEGLDFFFFTAQAQIFWKLLPYSVSQIWMSVWEREREKSTTTQERLSSSSSLHDGLRSMGNTKRFLLTTHSHISHEKKSGELHETHFFPPPFPLLVTLANHESTPYFC